MLTRLKQRRLLILGFQNESHYMRKFCDNVHHWRREAGRLARKLIDKDTRQLRILDIGCGFGFFLDACLDMGHDVTGIDMPDAVIDSAAGILDVPYLPLHIQACLPLPTTLVDFDLVTMFGVMFRHGSAYASHDYWGWPEYTFLARDVCSRLKPGGRWVLRPNSQSDLPDGAADLSNRAAWQNAIGDFATPRFEPGQITVIPEG